MLLDNKIETIYIIASILIVFLILETGIFNKKKLTIENIKNDMEVNELFQDTKNYNCDLEIQELIDIKKQIRDNSNSANATYETIIDRINAISNLSNLNRPKGQNVNSIFNIYKDKLISANETVNTIDLNLPVNSTAFKGDRAYQLQCNVYAITPTGKKIIYNGLYIITYIEEKYSLITQIENNTDIVDEGIFNISVLSNQEDSTSPPILKIIKLELNPPPIYLNANLKEL